MLVGDATNNEMIIPGSPSNITEQAMYNNGENSKQYIDISEAVVMTETAIGKFTVKIILKEGKYITEESSPFFDTYEGDFEFVVLNDNTTVFTEKIVIGNSDELIAIRKDFKLQVADYNGDGNLDFALGQYISSNSFIYQFYSIDSTGTIHLLSLDSPGGKTIEATHEGYSPLFKSKANKIAYKVYDQHKGEYLKKYAKVQ